jgi:hypothetical protein
MGAAAIGRTAGKEGFFFEKKPKNFILSATAERRRE